MSETVVNLMEMAIDNLSKLSQTDSSKKRELDILKKALKTYKDDIAICVKEGNNDYKCNQEALSKLYRALPFIRNSVYPWVNYDWDYGNYIDNNYSSAATGSSTRGRDFMNNLGIFVKLMGAYITNPNPGKNSVAGGKSKNDDYAYYGCQGNSRDGCLATNKVKTRDRQQPPYSDPFFNRKLDGKTASSYYIKVGSCKRPDIAKEDQCSSRGFQWTGGSCYSDRYAFINNTPGLTMYSPELGYGKFKLPPKGITLGEGYLPSLVNDVLSLSPDKILYAMNGKDAPGYMEVQKCPVEKFYGGDIESQNSQFLQILSVFILVSMGIGYFVLKK
jgi:hypothetical protein